MLAHTGGYYGMTLHGLRGVTQGDPLAPTILNVLVDAVVRRKVTVMVERAGRQNGPGWKGQHQLTLFYAYGGMIASLDTGWLHQDLSTLVGLFDQVDLRMSVKKMAGMVCCPCQAEGTHF